MNFFKNLFQEHDQSARQIYVQTVCKGYDQMTKVVASGEIVISTEKW